MLSAHDYFSSTHDWLEARLDHRGRYELRVALRELLRAAAARIVWLWSEDRPNVPNDVAWAGDVSVLPSRTMPELGSALPSRDAHADRRGGEEYDVVTLRVSMGGGVPRLGLAILGADHAASPALFDAIEATGDDIEAALVRALERADHRDRASITRPKRGHPHGDGRPE